MKRLYAAGAIEAADVIEGRVEPHYAKILTRLLAAHAIAEKLTALGYQGALENINDTNLRATLQKNLAEERKHARPRAEAKTVDELGKLVVAKIQAVEGITRTLTCPVVHL